jgi:hypothetical protein
LLQNRLFGQSPWREREIGPIILASMPLVAED